MIFTKELMRVKSCRMSANLILQFCPRTARKDTQNAPACLVWFLWTAWTSVIALKISRSAWTWLSLLMLQLSAQAIAGSPFYLTAERSFSNHEAPGIRLDYTDSAQPLLVRVLRPKQLDGFLDGQFNISRSYEQPVSELNPGHYFAKGLNAAQSPLRLFRGMLDADFRKSLKGTAFNHALVAVTEKPLAAVPEQILIAAPSGFETVSEEFLDLRKNGRDARDLAWWFGEDWYLASRYKIRTIQLPRLSDGIYLVQAVQGKHEAQCLLQVSSLAVQVKQSDGQLLVRVMDRDLRAVAAASIGYRDGRGRWQALPGVTNADGELSFDNPDGRLDGKLLIKVDAPAATPHSSLRTALTATDFLPTQTKDNSVFVMTDRPIFKPGETFFYKGIIRDMENGRLQIPKVQSRQTQISLWSGNGNATGLQEQSTLNDFGSFSGSFALDAGQTPGLYRLLAEIDQKAYGGEFRVRDYIKPTFYLEWLEHSPAVTPGLAFKLKFRAKRYSGGIPQDVKFEVFLYRKKFEAPQFVEEAGLGLSTGHDYFGQVTTAASLSQPQRLYSSIEARNAVELSNPWENAARLDDNGGGSFEFTVPADDKGKTEQEWVYSLMVRAQDTSGGLAVLTDNLYATLSEAQPALRFNKTVAAVGDQDLQLMLQSSYADGKPAADAGGIVEILLDQPGSGKHALLKLPFVTDERGHRQLTIPPLQASGRLTAVARLETLAGRALNHPAKSLPATLIVAGNDGAAVADNRALELYTAGTVLSPGEQAKIFALLPQSWGNRDSGPIWETTAGERIFSSRSNQVNGRSHWFSVTAKPEYGTGFYHTVTVPMAGGKYQEQTLGFRIVPWDKRLKISIKPVKTETEPLKPARIVLEVRRADDSPAADTELALAIVDRAVYAVQAEFRPGIFDFFYPLQRSNVATFYSDELQGYGYADLLRKPNFALSALKSQSKLAKKTMRDTAGWFPHLLTDAQGRVSINVDMPANITEWLVTAVAVDKNGRLGEATGQFRTVTDVAVDVVSPQFLRIGDEVELAVKLGNRLKRPVSVRGDIKLPAALQRRNGETAFKTQLAENSEQLWPLRVTAVGEPGTAAINIGLHAPGLVRVGGAEEFEIPLKAAALRQVYSSTVLEKTLHTALPPQALPRYVDIRVSSGLLGAALQTAAVLVQYPYGCTEQLAHSTVPNLVLMDLLSRAGLKPEQLGPLAEVLERARRNAAVGIRKLRANQKADGGFSLWPSDSEASVPVTAIALQALKYAADLKVEGAQKAYSNGLSWIAGQAPDISPTDGFMLSAFTRLDSWNSPWEQQAEFVATLAAADPQQASIEDLVTGLRILLKYKAMPYHSFNKKLENGEALTQRLAAALQQALDKLDTAAYQARIKPQLGFAAGMPSLVAEGLGVLDEAGALPLVLENKLKAILLEAQKNGYWTSTYDSAQVIFNSLNIIRKEAKAAMERKTHVLTAADKNGLPLGKLSVIPGGYFGRFSPAKNADLSEIKLSQLNGDEVAAAGIAVDVPYPAVTAKGAGVDVQRGYRRITASGSEPLAINQPLKPGDLVVSEVQVTRSKDGSLAGSEFVVIEDGIPSLAEGMENDRNYLADAKIHGKDDSYWADIKETQRYPDRIVRIAKLLPGGSLTLYQVWRAVHPGTAAIAPAIATDMYNEAVQGNSGTNWVSVGK